MKKTRWFNCRTEPPVNPCKDGEYYEVRLWCQEEKGYSPAHEFSCRAGKWYFYGEKQTGDNRPGWHPKDQWRGRVK